MTFLILQSFKNFKSNLKNLQKDTIRTVRIIGIVCLKLKAFYAVTKRIHKADIEDNGTYRYALYDVFNFDESSYVIGMESGYLEIHNSIRSDDSIERVLRKILQDSQLDSSSVDWEKWRSRHFW
jgi:hypothetical protein